ncbi:hypothetical protein TRFO_40377 [Tritrichomonas foetus]|uniref:Thioredoxin domain-containing protein n=1 Tax=Tritrichomonas foetus TaxID=1144522 RepID=A0A1J4J7Y2_9EUKA|nr:hypothetical protein TRFO_40377 [Tritrichomonas foetus]|eukprot:OHS93340.1 hypothetical protein TRFO_40377 [Tritrichomonas foetus]
MIYFFLVCSLSVFQLDENSFKQYVLHSDKSIPWFVMFGSSNCPACVQSAPEFESASNNARGIVRFGYADTKLTPNIATELGIRAIPAFFIFSKGSIQEFTGARTSGGFMNFISEYIGDGLEEADESWIDQNDNRVILFTRRFKPPVMFSAAYNTFKDHEKYGITFGMARDSDTLELFDNPPVPSIWFFKDGEKVQYKGQNNFYSLIDAISAHYGIEFEDQEDEL